MGVFDCLLKFANNSYPLLSTSEFIKYPLKVKKSFQRHNLSLFYFFASFFGKCSKIIFKLQLTLKGTTLAFIEMTFLLATIVRGGGIDDLLTRFKRCIETTLP